MRVLVTAPDQSLIDAMRSLADAAAVSLDYAESADITIERVGSQDYDALLLNLAQATTAELDLIRAVRRWTLDLPILVLAPDGPVAVKVDALRLGADDYIIRPCDPEELVARMMAVCRRTQRRPGQEVAVGDLRLSPATRSVSVNGREVPLAAREYDVLELLTVQRGGAVSKQALLHHLYDDKMPSDGEVIRVFVHHLRRKLARAGCKQIIRTARGRGYTLSEGVPDGPVRGMGWQRPMLKQTTGVSADDRFL